MALAVKCFLGIKFAQVTSTNFVKTSTNLQQIRYKSKHWNPKWKKLRAMKVVKVELPELNKKPEDFSVEEMRTKMKERGLLPPRPWVEKPMYISSTGSNFEPYVPPEGDGKISPISVQGAKQKLEFLEKKTKSMLAIRKIRSYEEEFDAPDFCKLASEIYEKVHIAMTEKNYEELENLVTERAYPEVVHNIAEKTINWKILKSLELPRIVHARCTNIVTKENIFSQVTVRFHTKQLLAIYDRFGRLMHGSEILAKDVLEYVVFEKHLSNEYGVWRVHDKIIPDWMPARDPMAKTLRKQTTVVPDEPTTVDVAKVAEISTQETPKIAAQ